MGTKPETTKLDPNPLETRVSATEAKAKLYELLRRTLEGETVLISVRGRLGVQLIPYYGKPVRVRIEIIEEDEDE